MTQASQALPSWLTLSSSLVTDADGSEREVRFKGRDAWALDELIAAGRAGCTPITRPAPRWSGYVYKLRRGGLCIETLHESHGGEFRGHHGRYVLKSRVRRISTADECGRVAA